MSTFLEPWHLSLQERFQTLLKTKKKKVIYLYRKADNSTFRYRVYNIYQTLTSSQEWQCSYFFLDELIHLHTCLDSIDLIVLCRFPWSFALDSFLNRAKQKRIPIAFDVDDLVFDIEKIPLIMNSLGYDHTEEHYAGWFSYVSRLQLTAQQCDVTISTNDFLQTRLSTKFQKPGYIILNTLNQEQIDRSKNLYEKKHSVKDQGRFTIGYFSGSPSHKHDFNVILPEVCEFLNDHPNAFFEVAGFIDFPKTLKNLVQKKRVYHTPFVDFVSLQDKIAAVNVNVVPLLNNEFTNCKSELKFFEAAIVGTPTCATPVHVFIENIQHGETGFLCEEGLWYSALKTIYEKSFNSELNERAKEYCSKKYAFYNQRKNIEEVFEKILSSR